MNIRSARSKSDDLTFISESFKCSYKVIMFSKYSIEIKLIFFILPQYQPFYFIKIVFLGREREGKGGGGAPMFLASDGFEIVSEYTSDT